MAIQRSVSRSSSRKDDAREGCDTKKGRERERWWRGGEDDREGRWQRQRKRSEKRRRSTLQALRALLCPWKGAEARYHEDPFPPPHTPPLYLSPPALRALLPSSFFPPTRFPRFCATVQPTFYPTTPHCLRGDRANSTDHRAFLVNLTDDATHFPSVLA